ncbi:MULTISPECIES: acyl-CoA dehydrogenase family protein [Paraburkholderia]|uniref:acyl-CoA dehydrogenase family protein n=1 Tax=Paraburkholderia TaxID=1822464 RepID=UPI0022506E8A|nr:MULTISPECIES: acyl-CoA dehydrogenase family protein [Paraburkholderia]MCX4138787.1 acyl-CoA dehydrogenase family protein [Paraburkholderia aspalathi]MCX4159536.1 acyl-CoA dehydrogenase family protein [Paraburkholderia aspalathi]MDN7168935.1 acyl-CoA dehydrogenase family protein [Paraburkholderia sp. SECH2]MDN7171477.1 acyl-CoA dehydrogenase family protein [Paraburkholderia sp. SEWSISQ10-3 4]MDQ6397422.1 acyl-CoA dehydrogenase family protein [Paraburkholderia aspalathi]
MSDTAIDTVAAVAEASRDAARLPLADVIVEIAARREEFDRLSHVPRDVIAKLKRAGVYRAATPKRFGGDALAPTAFLDMIERIAVADGSAAWVASFGSANVYLAALPLATQAQIYADGPDQVFAGGLFPVQAAQPADGGWRVNGTWKFASGCKGADWLGVGIGAAGPSAGAPGKPRTAVFRPHQVEIVENWDVVGMQGTGSHDLRVTDQFVTDDWTFVRGGEPCVDEPLYRYPTIAYAAQVLAVVNLGLARAALNVANQMAGGRKTTTGAPQLADRAYYRIELAKAEAQLRSARAFFYDTTDDVWQSILAGNPVTPEQTSLLRLAATQIAREGADVVQRAYRLGGTMAIYRSHPLQRLVRDAMVVTQHAFLGEGNFDGAGAVFVGVPPIPGYL